MSASTVSANLVRATVVKSLKEDPLSPGVGGISAVIGFSPLTAQIAGEGLAEQVDGKRETQMATTFFVLRPADARELVRMLQQALSCSNINAKVIEDE